MTDLQIELPSYHGNWSRCDKCGLCQDNRTRYQPGITPEKYKADPYCVIGRLRMDEHLERECQNCGYRWAEAIYAGEPA